MEQEVNPELAAHLEGVRKEVFGDYEAVAAEAEQLANTSDTELGGHPTDTMRAMVKRLTDAHAEMNDRYLQRLSEADEPTTAWLQEQRARFVDTFGTLSERLYARAGDAG